MNSKIYTGNVTHQRLEPARHGFGHGVTFYGFDLDELEALDRATTGFGHNRAALLTLRDRDYVVPGPGRIRDKIVEKMKDAGVTQEPRRLVLLTVPRHLGYVFNPVSFYLGYDAEDRLAVLVAEVNNTFGDRHLYTMPVEGQAHGKTTRTRHTKAFHVSPFNDMKGGYQFSVTEDGPAIEITITMVKEGVPVFHAGLTGRGVDLTGRNLARALARHPLRPWLTMPRILAQAAVLYYRRRLPVFRRPEPRSPDTVVRRPPGGRQRLAMKLVLSALSRMKYGMLRLVLPDGSHVCCGDEMLGPTETLSVRDYRFFTRMAVGGDVGLGEAIVEGDAQCDDVTRLLRLLIANREALADGSTVLTWTGRLRDRVRHLLHPNSRRTSRKNIREHYDLSNTFFQTFLDPTMTYSGALFLDEDDTLERAQRNKLRSLIELARIEPGHRVLELGTGWGSFALEAARAVNCRVTTVTISREQYEMASLRVRESGLADRVEVRLCDYRDVEGRFDRIVSIEMLEAVGHRYYDTFFRQCEHLLEPDGLIALQVITIPDERYETYRRGCDWIQKHIFPGGHLPSLTALSEAMTRSSRLCLEHLSNIGPDYARTLKLWRETFEANEGAVEALGFDAPFRRKWGYYLSYCEAAFATRHLNTLHLLLTRAGNRQLLRDDERSDRTNRSHRTRPLPYPGGSW